MRVAMVPPLKLAADLGVEAVDGAPARIGHQAHGPGLPGLEPHRGSGRDVEPVPARLLALELERRIGLEEMIVRADLDRPVAGVGDVERDRLAAGIELDFAVLRQDFPWNHVFPLQRIGAWTVTSLVPSGN